MSTVKEGFYLFWGIAKCQFPLSKLQGKLLTCLSKHYLKLKIYFGRYSVKKVKKKI